MGSMYACEKCGYERILDGEPSKCPLCGNKLHKVDMGESGDDFPTFAIVDWFLKNHLS